MALIARAAGISNGSLFTYFATTAELFDQLYLELKTGMATASLAGISAERLRRHHSGDPRRDSWGDGHGRGPFSDPISQ